MQHRMLAEDIANIFYKDTKDGNAEKSRGSLEYCKHVNAIEDIIEQFFQNNWNALDQNR